MVSVLLTVLKITGISILVIIGILLFILLALLFVPVGYRAGGNYTGKGDYKADIRAAWFLHIVSLYVDYCRGKARHVRIKVFGIAVYDNFKTGRKKSRNKKRKRAKTKPERNGKIQAASVGEEDFEDMPIMAARNYKKDDEYQDGTAGCSLEKISQNPDDRKDDGCRDGTVSGIFRKIKEIFNEIIDIFKNIKFTFKKICVTIIRIKDNINYYLEIWHLRSTQEAVAVCKEQLGRVWKKARPKKFRIDFHIGFDEPALTGEVLAIWGMLYPVHLGNICISPEFDRNVFEGSFAMSGSIRLYVLAKAAVILYRDKNIRILIKRLKREAA